LRQVIDDDQELVRRWRNHPRVRGASLTRHEISAEEHAAWWRRVRSDPDRQVLIHQHAGADCGVVTFVLDRPGCSATWGFYLDVAGLETRAGLLPAWFALERDAIAYAFEQLGLRRIGGETLASNTPVLELHERFGFRQTRRYHREIDGEPHEVVWTELERQPA
jgi:UDP-4-amino-4,6-dideoxy-N-acetyl-beta-L-altrosamine N-acetyltransferase